MQALRDIKQKIEGADESQEKLSNAFKIAERLRKRLQECDEVLENTCQVRSKNHKPCFAVNYRSSIRRFAASAARSAVCNNSQILV